MDAMGIRFDGVTRRFVSGGKALAALDGVTIEIARGDCVAVVGPSGSGKTTLLNLAGALDQPDDGRVCCLGVDLTRAGERQAAEFRRRHVGFVFQDDALIPELTVRENVALPLVLLRERSAVRARKVDELLERLGLAEKADQFPPNLSGGEKQRAAVARAVVHRPELMLADEPTANLDVESALRVLDTIEALAGETALTLLLATHDARVTERFPHVLQLRDGRIA